MTSREWQAIKMRTLDKDLFKQIMKTMRCRLSLRMTRLGLGSRILTLGSSEIWDVLGVAQ